MPSAKVRIGNWQEELAYEADKKALLKQARESGSTLSQSILAKAKHHRQPVELQQVHADGALRFGVPIAFQNADTNGCLATDLDDKSCVDGDDRYACTTTRVASPQLRAAWVLLPVPSKEDAFIAPDADPDVVHYGQRFVIQTVEGLAHDPLFVCSANKTHSTLSRVTSNQDVFLTGNGGQKALWAAMHANAEYRPDMIGKPVKANSLMILVHQGTNMPLASTSGARVSTDFGAENEVCCHRYLKVQSKSGNAPEQAANLWAAVTAPAE
jgi:hypothetical protein